MEGLTPLKLNRSVIPDPSIINKNSIGYLLDLGYKQLNKLYKTSFLVKNRSTENTYKFRFYCSTMIFSPEVGHLKPGVTKEIIVIFKATQSIKLENVSIVTNPIKRSRQSTFALLNLLYKIRDLSF